MQVTQAKLKYGDFQTPPELTEKICDKLIELGIQPEIVIEPTCGVGNFLTSSAKRFQSAKSIIGLEINENHIKQIRLQDPRIWVKCQDFFRVDWEDFFKQIQDNVLVLGNLPWVTNSQQGTLEHQNLPNKKNFQNHQGLDALTGKSNFDISEWMLIKMIQCLHQRRATLAMICKTTVSRKILNYIYNQKLKIESCSTYPIDAKKYFDVSVEACLLICRFDAHSQNYFCDVFKNFTTNHSERIGYYRGLLIHDLVNFKKLEYLYDSQPKKQWRSGLKHDCADIMILEKAGDCLVNGLGEKITLEDTFLYPLIKGSDVAQNRVEEIYQYILVTQKSMNDPTESIQKIAPRTWNYLQTHAEYFERRKSKIYKNRPQFAVFGIGDYTFFPWKIAICGLYKKLSFRLVGSLNYKPTIFDDTVYFLAFEKQQEAAQVFQFLTSSMVTEFYSSLIFWDEKRPIKTSILNALKLPILSE